MQRVNIQELAVRAHKALHACVARHALAVAQVAAEGAVKHPGPALVRLAAEAPNLLLVTSIKIAELCIWSLKFKSLKRQVK